MLQLLTIVGALLLGYSIRRLPVPVKVLNQTLFAIVVLILFVMGYELASSEGNLLGQLAKISKIVGVFVSLLFISNLLAANLVFRKLNRSMQLSNQELHHANYWQFIKESGKYIVIIAFGMILGASLKHPLTGLSQIISLLLFILLFVIGHQMRANGIALRSLLMNKHGVLLAKTVILSSLLAGGIASLILGIPLNHGLMLSSGFGWYTLASILNGRLLGQDMGTISFFIDFCRELFAIILIPSLGRLYPASLVGYCGGTAMDFSLPVIKENLHENCILLAISSGMILSIAVPVLISLFAKIAI